MASIHLFTIAFVVIAIVSFSHASPTNASPTFWKGTFLDESVDEMRSMCNDDDALACIKFKAMNFLDNLLKKDKYQITEDIEVSKNSYRANEVSARSEATLQNRFEEYIQGHDVIFKLPFVDSSVTLGARNLDQDELNFNVKFGSNQQGEARRSKLRKILIPIIVLVLLKAITLIPLAIGILGLKAWNALQLSFISFVVSMSLAVFQLCKKIATDNAHPQISAHTPWDVNGHFAAARSGDVEPAQPMAYSAYVQ